MIEAGYKHDTNRLQIYTHMIQTQKSWSEYKRYTNNIEIRLNHSITTIDNNNKKTT